MSTDHIPYIYVALSPQLTDEIRFGDWIDGLKARAEVECWPGPGNPSDEAMQAAVRRAEVIVTGWGTPTLQSLLANWTLAGSPLRLVAHTAGSIKSHLPFEALQRGLLVTHANDALAEAVAEFTLGAMLAMRRQMFVARQRYRQRQPGAPYQVFHELPGSTVGIIGASAIGRRVMELLRTWQVKLLVFDPYCPAEVLRGYGAESVSLLELCQRSDIVSLHAPVTPETMLMLGSEHFGAMKDGALFINTARGKLVEAEALLRELQSGRISALLDVTDPDEPLAVDSPFFELENCVALPHIAGLSVEARVRQGRYAAEEVLNYLEGRPLRFRIAPERWETMA